MSEGSRRERAQKQEFAALIRDSAMGPLDGLAEPPPR